MRIEEFNKIVKSHLKNMKTKSSNESYLLSQLLSCPQIVEILGYTPPPIEDITPIIDANPGEVYAVRLDKYGNGVGHKQPVVAGLILKAILKTLKNNKPIRGFIDGGNVSTALALGYYSKKFEIQSRIVMSRYFPDDILHYILSQTDGFVKPIIAPKSEIGREREFYNYLYKIARMMGQHGFHCLWHAKYGGKVLQPLGRNMAKHLAAKPDYIVLSIGAGATLEGWAIPIKKIFMMQPQILAAEHEWCPLIRNMDYPRIKIDSSKNNTYDTSWLRDPPAGIPHTVMGPHYDELNPLIKSNVLAFIDGVVSYKEEDWKKMATFCKESKFSVGNSSAVNLLVAKNLARMGKKVLTFIYEPRREYYEKASFEAFCRKNSLSECVYV